MHLKAADGTPMADVMLTLMHELGLDHAEHPSATASGEFSLDAVHNRSRLGLTAMRRRFAMNLFGVLCLTAMVSAAPPTTSSSVADAAMRGDKDALRTLLQQGAGTPTRRRATAW